MARVTVQDAVEKVGNRFDNFCDFLLWDLHRVNTRSKHR